jgi:F0F1-type ATP synthase assembly protein I
VEGVHCPGFRDCDILLNQNGSLESGVKNLPSSAEERRQLGAAGTAVGLGCSIVTSIILFIGGGIALDSWTGLSPLFTLIGVALGLLAAGYQLYELAQIGRTDRAPGAVTRQIK